MLYDNEIYRNIDRKIIYKKRTQNVIQNLCSFHLFLIFVFIFCFLFLLFFFLYFLLFCLVCLCWSHKNFVEFFSLKIFSYSLQIHCVCLCVGVYIHVSVCVCVCVFVYLLSAEKQSLRNHIVFGYIQNRNTKETYVKVVAMF